MTPTTTSDSVTTPLSAEEIGHFVIVRRDGTAEVYQLYQRLAEPVRPVRCAGCAHMSGSEPILMGHGLIACRQGRYRDDAGFKLYRPVELFRPPEDLARTAAECTDYVPIEVAQ